MNIVENNAAKSTSSCQALIETVKGKGKTFQCKWWRQKNNFIKVHQSFVEVLHSRLLRGLMEVDTGTPQRQLLLVIKRLIVETTCSGREAGGGLSQGDPGRLTGSAVCRGPKDLTWQGAPSYRLNLETNQWGSSWGQLTHTSNGWKCKILRWNNCCHG